MQLKFANTQIELVVEYRKELISQGDIIENLQKQISIKQAIIDKKNGTILDLNEIISSKDKLMATNKEVYQQEIKRQKKQKWKWLGVGTGVGIIITLILQIVT